jgi:hypothetical protein
LVIAKLNSEACVVHFQPDTRLFNPRHYPNTDTGVGLFKYSSENSPDKVQINVGRNKARNLHD